MIFKKSFYVFSLGLFVALSGCGFSGEEVVIDVGDDPKPQADVFSSGSFSGAAALTYDYPEDVDAGLVWHHPGGVASDGEYVYLVDRNNNRVLVWTSFPQEEDDAPDFVLGQTSFEATATGDGDAEMNWPTGVATDGTHLVVADTYNGRVLIWNQRPTEMGQAPDLILDQGTDWPWAVWTDGEKLIVTSTAGKEVLIWNSFPTENVEADFILSIPEFGTPRSIASDGTRLVISDHNATVDGVNNPGTFFWNEFPTQSTDSYDFFTRSPSSDMFGEVLWSPVFTDQGQFVAVGQQHFFIWDEFPTEETVNAPDLTVGRFRAGDSSGLAWDGEHLLVSLDNDNLLAIYEGIPTATTDEPDFILGVPQYWITNPVPITDGEKFYVTSDFDRTLSTWNEIPSDLSSPPDEVQYLEYPCWDTFFWEEELYCVGGSNVSKWGSELIFRNAIGGVELENLKGIAIDDRYFYLSDNSANKVYVWEGIPSEDQVPLLSLDVEMPNRISANGEYLAVVSGTAGGGVYLYSIKDFSDASPEPYILKDSSEVFINLPNDVLLEGDGLFVASTVANTILFWEDIQDVLEGEFPTQTWGATQRGEAPSHATGKLFWPGALDVHDGVLYVGEFKFSDRLLSVKL